MGTKGKLLKASMSLRSCGDESLHYITPDLTQKQKDEAFKLRQEWRQRMTDVGKRNLVIRIGKRIR